MIVTSMHNNKLERPDSDTENELWKAKLLKVYKKQTNSVRFFCPLTFHSFHEGKMETYM